MLYLFELAAAFALGYMIVTKAAPVIQAKIESMDLDDAWDIFDDESAW